MSNSDFGRLRLRLLTLFVLSGWLVFALTAQSGHAQRGPAPIEDGGGGGWNDYYCPATQHSCDMTNGVIPYFAPDPFDVAYACDSEFFRWDSSSNLSDEGTCYGYCQRYKPDDETCFANCQQTYADCLRGAFGIGARPRPIGQMGQSPRNVPNISGSVYRSCLLGSVPPAYEEQYNNCIAAGGTVEACCREVANNFP